jgi:hypothetical protein
MIYELRSYQLRVGVLKGLSGSSRGQYTRRALR